MILLLRISAAAGGKRLKVLNALDGPSTDELAVSIAAGDLAPLERLFIEARARPPRVVWEPGLEALRTPVLQRLLAAWQALSPGPGRPPPPAEAQGLASGNDSDWTMLLEPVQPLDPERSSPLQRFVYRHYGAGIARNYGRDMTGKTMRAFPGHIGQFFAAIYTAVQHRPEPVFTEHEPPAAVLVRSWQRLILPFAEPGRPVSHFVVGNVPESAVTTLLDVMYDAALVIDGDGRVRLANRAAEELLGATEVPLAGSPVDSHLAGLSAVMQRLAAGIDDVGAYGRHELTLVRGRRKLYLEVSIGGTRLAGTLLFVLVLRDLTERARRERALLRIAFKDELTGILNRRGLHRQVDGRPPAARRGRDGFGLLIVDIDGFKDLNDSHGHAAGDQVLKAVAGRLAASLRADDAVARWGGDEFVVVLYGVERQQDLATAARKLLDRLRPPHAIDGQSLEVKVSVGAARFPDHGCDFDGVLAAADRALYRAKSAGGDRLELSPDA